MSDWQDGIYRVLKDADIRQVAYVPDAGHRQLIDACRADAEMTAIPLTTEMEGPAVLAGAWLGGQRGVLLMQSSGVGNCPNMIATAVTCRFPLLMLVTMRGEYGEFNPWQLPMGEAAGPLLEQMGSRVFRAERAEDVADTVRAAAGIAFEGLMPAAVLLAQKLIGTKTFGK